MRKVRDPSVLHPTSWPAGKLRPNPLCFHTQSKGRGGISVCHAAEAQHYEVSCGLQTFKEEEEKKKSVTTQPKKHHQKTLLQQIKKQKPQINAIKVQGNYNASKVGGGMRRGTRHQFRDDNFCFFLIFRNNN